MDDMLTSDDPRYKEIFDVANEAHEMGNSIDIDINAALNGLRDRDQC